MIWKKSQNVQQNEPEKLQLKLDSDPSSSSANIENSQANKSPNKIKLFTIDDEKLQPDEDFKIDNFTIVFLIGLIIHRELL